ncbi:MAG: ATP-binding protein [Bacteroidota bacterium]
MIFPFFNRSKEIQNLDRIWANRGQEPKFGVVYGKRRCGKSTLLRKLQRPGDVYFLGVEGEKSLQLRLLAQELDRKLPAFAAVEYRDYNQLFEVLVARINEPFTLTIDEFPYLVKSDSSLPSILQRYLDLRQTGQFNLILCGSSQQMMHDAVLSATAPLYGRADEIIKVEPLLAGWLREAFPDLDPVDLIEEYSIWGGIPRYWEIRSKFQSLREAIINTILEPTGLLHDEPRRLLMDDLSHLPQPISLLSAIASGVHKPSELGSRLNKSMSDLYRPLNRLISLGYILKERSFGDKSKGSKRVLYKINDPFLDFYYRFVLTNASALTLGNAENIWQKINGEMDKYVSKWWEKLCTRAIVKGIREKNIETVGRWWGTTIDKKQAEIDILAMCEGGERIVAVECKWSALKSIESIRKDLILKVQRLPFYQGQNIKAYVACKSFSGQKTDKVITPAEVLEILR